MSEKENSQGLIPWRPPSAQLPRLPNPFARRAQHSNKGSLNGYLDTVASASAATISTNVLSSSNYGQSGSNVSCSSAVSISSQSAPVNKVALKPASDVLAGALARAASQTTIHPLDTFKVRLQARTAIAAQGSSTIPRPSGLSKFGQLVPPSNGSVSQFDGLAALQGLGSLYKGIVGAASGAGIAIGAYFAFYGVSCNTLSRHTELKPTQIAFVSGGVAALGSSLVKVPLAVCIRSVQAGVYPNVFAAAKSIVAKAGPRGLFTGFAPTVLEDVPDMAIKFAAYEGMREVHRRANRGRKATPQEDFAMGAVAGALAAAATTPLDVIKTNMMCNAAARPSMIEAARAVLAEGGTAALFRGVGTRALSNGINSAVFFCFFEAIRGIFATPRVQKMFAVTSVSSSSSSSRQALTSSADGGRQNDAYASSSSSSSPSVSSTSASQSLKERQDGAEGLLIQRQGPLSDSIAALPSEPTVENKSARRRPGGSSAGRTSAGRGRSAAGVTFSGGKGKGGVSRGAGDGPVVTLAVMTASSLRWKH